MTAPIRVPNPRGEMIEPPEVSASDAKNGFGRILERVAREGGVTITRRHEPVAVVIPIETYRRLAAAEAGSLETLSGEFDALLARMQAPGAGEAMQRAFEMMPEELGRAAVDAATVADGCKGSSLDMQHFGSAAGGRLRRHSHACALARMATARGTKRIVRAPTWRHPDTPLSASVLIPT